jgi:hypothetical protein
LRSVCRQVTFGGVGRIAVLEKEPTPHIVRDGAQSFRRSLNFGSASDGPYRAADLFAIVARLDALFHDSVLMALARRGTVAAGVGTGDMGVFRHRAATSHQSGRQSAEFLAVHRRLVSLSVMLGVRPALLNLAQTVVARLVADLGTFIQDLDMPVVLMPFIATGSGTAQGDQSRRPGTQDAQQFSTNHAVSPLL